MRRPLLTVLCAAVACSGRPGAAPPPRAEFLLSSQDSTFWVVTANGAVHVRGVPITLARYDGKFYELYTADDDYSYRDALFLGERLYRRDIASGDSAVVFADTAVARFAGAYARAHPDERPLEPGDEVDDDPSTNITAQVDVLGVYGPYVSYEYHLDVDQPGSRPWHATRRGVLDLRTGKQTTIGDLFGAAAGHDLAEAGRKSYETTRDSILAERAATHGDDRRAADALLRLQFDETSFSLSSVDQKPAVAFGIPGRGEGAAGSVLELDPVSLAPTPWWRELAAEMPVTNDEGDDRWDHARYQILARYDTSGQIARVTLADSARHEWPVATVLGPLRDVEWLDQPPITDAERNALRSAFNSAATYDETSRVAGNSPVTRRPSPVAYASLQDRPRKPARNVRAHDARAREQHGPRVRRRHSLDDGQDRGDLRVPAQPGERRHGVDRPRGLSRADSPRRSGRHEGERQLRRTVVHGDRRPR